MVQGLKGRMRDPGEAGGCASGEHGPVAGLSAYPPTSPSPPLPTAGDLPHGFPVGGVSFDGLRRAGGHVAARYL